MEDIIRKEISRKLRAKGNKYKLSKNSKLSSADFSYANKIASLIHRFCKSAFIPDLDGDAFGRLRRKVLSITRNDEVHALGELRIGYGNIQELKGFQLNPRKSWPGYTCWNTTIHCDLDLGKISMTIPAKADWRPHEYPKRTTKLALAYNLLKIPFELEDEPQLVSPGVRTINLGEKHDAATREIAIAGWDNCLIIVLATVRTYLRDIQGTDEFLSNDKSLMAAEFTAIYGIRDGQMVMDHPTTSQAMPSDGIIEDDGWV